MFRRIVAMMLVFMIMPSLFARTGGYTYAASPDVLAVLDDWVNSVVGVSRRKIL